MVPRLCTIECDFSLPLNVSPYAQNVKFVEDIKGWSAMTDKLYVWDYTTNFAHYIGPHPNFGCLQGNVKFFRDNSVVGLFEQGAYQAPHAEFAELRAWVLAKLLWNPDQDIEALYADFFNGYYGPATKVVRTYFDELQALAQPTEHILRIGSSMNSKWYTDEFFDRAAKLWDQAERLVENDPNSRYNVRMSAIPVLYARFQRLPRAKVRRVLRDGMLKPEGVDPEYAALASDLLDRISEGKIKRVCENSTRHQAFVSLLRGLTEGYKPVVVSKGAWRAGVVAEMGGRVASLQRGHGPNFLNAEAGGIDFAERPRSFADSDTRPYSVRKAGKSSVQLTYHARHRYHLARTVDALDDGLAVSTTMRSTRTEPQSIRPVLRVAIDLGDVAGVVARVGDGDWQKLVVPADQTYATSTIRGADLAGREVLIASGATKRGVRVKLPDAAIERLLLWCDARAGAARLFVMMPRQELEGRTAKTFALQLRPVDPTPNVPELAVARQHRPVRLVVEECLIGLGRPGTWGEIIADPAADDGFATKLFNTHYEWCMQWRFDTSWFEPGTKYKLRMRIRVEKTEREGEAFWAGVYDTAKRKSYGQISPRTADVKGGYQWYDVTTWQPEDRQYVWIGPGRFDKKGGQPSAIGAVYVDKFELSKVR